MKLSRLVLSLAVSCVTLFNNAALYASEEEPVGVSAQGESEISYDAAEQEALRAAVRQAVGVALASQTKVEDFTLIRDAMLTRANGYVRSYKVLEKRRTTDDTYLVKLNAECVRGKMDSDFLAVQNLIEVMGRPQFSIKVEAKREGAPNIEEWVESAFTDELDKTGLAVLDSGTANEATEREYKRALASGNTKKANLLKLKMGAPYGVTVTASGTNKETEVYGAKMNMAVVELKATVSHRDTAEVLASKSGSGRAGGTDTTGMQDACKKAVAAVFPEVLNRILFHWTRDLDSGAAITLEISEANYASVSALAAKLRKVENVTQVEIVEAPEDGIAVLRVIGRIKASVLADQIGKLSDGKMESNVAGPRKVTARLADTPAAASQQAAPPAAEPKKNAK